MAQNLLDQQLQCTFHQLKAFLQLNFQYFFNYYIFLEKLRAGNRAAQLQITATRALFLYQSTYCLLVYIFQNRWSRKENLLSGNFLYLEGFNKQTLMWIIGGSYMADHMLTTMYFNNRGVTSQVLRRVLIDGTAESEYFFSSHFCCFFGKKNVTVVTMARLIAISVLNFTRVTRVAVCKFK